MEHELLRFIFAFFGGYFLTLSGSLTQIVTLNKLASPSTLGFDALAALSIIASQYLIVFWGMTHQLEVVSFWFFSLLFVFMTLFFSLGKGRSKYRLDMDAIILMGLAFNLFVGAIFAVVQFLFFSLGQEFPSGLWFGNFRLFNDSYLFLFLMAFLAVQVFVVKVSSKLRLLGVGEAFAIGLGINVKRVQSICLFVSLFLTGIVISFFGVFSFLGLIVPHMLRTCRFFSKNIKRELALGPWVGGASLGGLDFLCYQFPFKGAEFPVGMVSSVLGSFLLISLLFRSRIKGFAKDQ